MIQFKVCDRLRMQQDKPDWLADNSIWEMFVKGRTIGRKSVGTERCVTVQL